MTSRALLLAAALSLPMQWPDGCVLDRAHVEAVEPATFTVLATLRCGAVLCFAKVIESQGQRIRDTRACDVDTDSQRDTLRVVPPAPTP